MRAITGVGRISALTLVAAFDDERRFPNAKILASYCGVIPDIRQSADERHEGHITKGRSEVHAVWVQAAHAVVRNKQKEAAPLKRWYEQIRKRREKKCAILALTRKLLVIAFHILKEKTVYQPERLAV